MVKSLQIIVYFSLTWQNPLIIHQQKRVNWLTVKKKEQEIKASYWLP